MERLTEHHVNEKLGAYMVCSGACIDDGFECNACEKLAEIIDRLAAYEDTGMTPEEITDFVKRWEDVAKLAGLCKQYGADRLAELLQAENEGRLETDVVHCKDCKRLYFKDFEAFCPHRVGPCRPGGFCERGEKEGK